MYIGRHVKCQLFFLDFSDNWIWKIDFRKILKQIFMKIRPVGAELFHADGRTDRQAYMTKGIVTSREFTNAPKN
jgi:hypothetical protein